jgi:hypothetical protein
MFPPAHPTVHRSHSDVPSINSEQSTYPTRLQKGSSLIVKKADSGFVERSASLNAAIVCPALSR